MRIADELHDHATITAATWRAARNHWSDEQMIELITIAGFYRMIAYYCNGLGLERESWARPMPESPPVTHQPPTTLLGQR
jgi:predicted PhzF superfamily epimerase YddE/YHI9